MPKFNSGTDIKGIENEKNIERKSDDEIIALRDKYSKDPRFEKYMWLTSDERYALCVPSEDNNMDNMPSVFRHVDRIKDIRTIDGNRETDRQYICCFTGLKCHINFAVCTKCNIPQYYTTKAKRLLKQAEQRNVKDEYDYEE